MLIMDRLIRFLLVAGLFAAPALAQDRLEPAKLPPDTAFYLYWRGLASQSQWSHVNSLLALWNDPDFLPFRAALADGVFSNSERKDPKKQLTPADLQEIASLLENPILVGAVEQPKTAAAADQKSPAKANSPDNSFFVVDISGKQALFQKLEQRWEENSSDAPVITKFNIGDIPAEKVVGKTDTRFRARAGHYAINAGRRALLERIVARLTGSEAKGGQLGEVAEFREAQKHMEPDGLVEIFLRIPNVADFVPSPASAPSGQFQFDGRGFVKALHVDSLRAFAGSLKLNGPSTRMRFALLGDPAPGGIFDLFAGGDAPFSTLALAPADTLSFNAFQADFSAFYETLRRAVASALPPNTQGNVDMFEGMIGSQIGMKPSEALQLLTGEVASLSTGTDFAPENGLFVLGIRKKPDLLRLLRTVTGERMSSERAVGDVTYMKISLSGAQSQAGVAQWDFYYLAATPNLLLGARKNETLQAAVARAQAADSPSSGGLASQPAFLQARSRFPQKLNSIGFADFSRIHWPQVRDRLVAEAQKAGAVKSANAGLSIERLKQLDFAVFGRHLHTLASASWKDSAGVNWDAWIE
jgi:hypothetical protein